MTEPPTAPSGEKVDSGAGEAAQKPSFDPLRYASDAEKKRFGKIAKDAARKYSGAVKLHCIECCGWSYPEAKRCLASHCPLWAMNQRVFR